jgi:transcriptional regulator with XRE-family HTH domain
MAKEKGFFASRLKELRNKADLSQTDLAERSGVPVGTIRYFEYGLREPTYETLVKLAEGLGLSLSAFDQPKRTKPRKEK